MNPVDAWLFWPRFWLAWWQRANPLPRHIEIEIRVSGCQVAHCENWHRTRAVIEERKRA